MTGKRVLVAGSGGDKSRHVWQRQHNLFYRDTRGDLPLIWCILIRSHTTDLHPLHSPKTFNPYLPYYKPYLDANRKPFFPRRWLLKDACGGLKQHRYRKITPTQLIEKSNNTHAQPRARARASNPIYLHCWDRCRLVCREVKVHVCCQQHRRAGAPSAECQHFN